MPRLLIAILTGWLVWTAVAPAVAQELSDFERSEFFESEGLGEEDEIETDRDSFTPATTTAGYHRLIVESAYSVLDNRDTFETHSFPEFLARYGVSDWIELRLGWNYEIGGEGNSVSGSGLGEEFEGPALVAEHQISYGLKMVITEQDRWLPQSAFIIQGFTPTGGPDPNTDLVATYVWGWELPNRCLLDAAIRYGTENGRDEHGNLWAPSIVVKAPIGESWKGHIEYFGVFSEGLKDNRAPQYVSPGVHYLLTPNFEVGVRVGWGLNHDAANFFSNAGIGWRF